MASPEARSLAARVAAHSRWATQDRVAGTAKARAAFLARFEHEVDPDGLLDPAERRRRAESARKAYMARLRLRGVQKADAAQQASA